MSEFTCVKLTGCVPLTAQLLTEAEEELWREREGEIGSQWELNQRERERELWRP